MAEKKKEKPGSPIFGMTDDYINGRLQIPPARLSFQYILGYGTTQKEKEEAAAKQTGGNQSVVQETPIVRNAWAGTTETFPETYSPPITPYVPLIPDPPAEPPVVQRQAGVTIENLWVDHNIEQGGERGMLIHTSLNAYEYQSRPLEIVAFFYHGQDAYRPVQSTESGYRTGNDQLCVSQHIVPPYEDTVYNDLKMFLPYRLLPVNEVGTHDFNFKVYARSEDEGFRNLAISRKADFSFTIRPSARIEKVWTDYKAQANSERGMLIHSNFSTHHLFGEALNVTAYFYDKNGAGLRPAKSVDRQFKTVGKTLCVTNMCIPGQEHQTFNDVQLFLPTDVIPDKYKDGQSLSFEVVVRKKHPDFEKYAQSPRQYFNFG